MGAEQLMSRKTEKFTQFPRNSIIVSQTVRYAHPLMHLVAHCLFMQLFLGIIILTDRKIGKAAWVPPVILLFLCEAVDILVSIYFNIFKLHSEGNLLLMVAHC